MDVSASCNSFAWPCKSVSSVCTLLCEFAESFFNHVRDELKTFNALLTERHTKRELTLIDRAAWSDCLCEADITFPVQHDITTSRDQVALEVSSANTAGTLEVAAHYIRLLLSVCPLL